eukprot:11188347-Lingulodinium_polyedra.AAC.1
MGLWRCLARWRPSTAPARCGPWRCFARWAVGPWRGVARWAVSLCTFFAIAVIVVIVSVAD